MNLLFDFITPRLKTGAGECHRRVFFELLNRLRKDCENDVKFFALWDSSKGIAYEDLRPESLPNEPNVEFVDCAHQKISDVVVEKCIDRFFIACVQFVGEYPEVADLGCDVLAFIFDARDEEFVENHLYEYCILSDGRFDFKRRFQSKIMNGIRYLRLTWNLSKWLYRFRHKGMFSGRLALMRPICELLKKNQKAHLLTVSSYSKYAAMYIWGISDDKISVLWCPERCFPTELLEHKVDNEVLRKVIDTGRKFFLVVSANRDSKNPYKLIKAFERFCQFNDDIDLVIVGYLRKAGERVHVLPFLSDGDLAYAMRSCHALVYPSFFEGFGYPPLEAMKYGKPVLSSNTTSMPEILGDAPIYFSPFYNADMFKAMITLAELSDEEYAKRSKMSLEQYKVVHQRQERDLQRLLDMILEPVESMND